MLIRSLSQLPKGLGDSMKEYIDCMNKKNKYVTEYEIEEGPADMRGEKRRATFYDDLN